VLAVNLSPAGLARARVLGFQVEDTPLVRAESPVTTLTVPRGMDALQAIDLLKQNLPAEHFQLNRLYRLYRPAMKEDREPRPSRPATLGSKNCAGDHCYARAAIQWKDSFASCAQNVKIGVIDTDIDLKHPAFKQQNITQRLFIPAGRQAAGNWHGTGVLALLAGRPDSGTPGLLPEATFFAASIFYAGGDGDAMTDTVSILRALDWMIASGAKLVNMSFSGPQDDLVQAQIESLSANGLVFSAAAGNDGPTAEPAYPAAYPQVIAVTAVTKEFKNYPYANRGGHIDVAAPGVDIWTAWPDSREGYRSGTSFASPFVTAVLAILPPDMLKPPKENLFEQLRTADLGPPGRDPVYGRGLLQAPSSCPMASGETADNTLGWAPRTN
jgi:subtilisin family serine protease